MTLHCKIKVGLLVCALAVPITIQAGLEPVVQVIGNVSISVDAEGNNNPSGGTIRVNKPSGASVRKAYLMAASFFNYTITDSDIALAGTMVSWDREAFNNAGLTQNFFHNVFADVTTIVKPIIDNANSGITQLSITEATTGRIDGTILAVIFDDPNQTINHSIILFFGGQDTLGDSFDIKLAESLDLTDPSIVADMGLGISFGFQGSSGTGMVSIIDVNGSRLTSSAGGEDDGGSFNGGLITTGGIGDSNINPSALAPSSGFGTDDELYNLLPFVSPGDTSILVETINPTDDDNIFFGYFSTSVPAAILPNIPAPGVRTLVGNIDPNFPTIVLTHGLQDEDENVVDLWTGDGSTQAGGLIRNALGAKSGQTNIVQYVWEEGFQKYITCCFPNGNAYINARLNVADAGTRLGKILLIALGSSYDKPIHFIGHSLGTAVNTYATEAFLTKANVVPNVQFTALDRPHHISGAGHPGTGIPGISKQEEKDYGYPSDFFAHHLPINSNNIGLNFQLDNYYAINNGVGTADTGVGDIANGVLVYNHPGLINPLDVGRTIFNSGLSANNHSGVQQWYRWTINSNGFGDDYCSKLTPFGPLPLVFLNFDASLDPCANGWQRSLNAGGIIPPYTPNGLPAVLPTFRTLAISQIQKFGCDIVTNQQITQIICDEQSSPFIVGQIDIPEDAAYLSFEYSFMNTGDGDYAAVLIDDIPIWVLSGESVIQEGEFADSGPIPINSFKGNHRLTVALYGVGQKNAMFELRNLEVSTLNTPPVANAGINQTAECTNTTGSNVTLDGSGSSDPDGDALTYTWTGPFGTVNGQMPTVSLPLGTHALTLEVKDPSGETDTDIVSVTVEDTVAPQLTVSVSPDSLWPPNHKMVSITPTASATDICDSSPIVSLSTITTNEGDETNTYDPNIDATQGDGNTTNDIEVDNGNISLRAERSGVGDGRVYTISYTATDSSGNIGNGTATVTVPHNQ